MEISSSSSSTDTYSSLYERLEAVEKEFFSLHAERDPNKQFEKSQEVQLRLMEILNTVNLQILQTKKRLFKAQANPTLSKREFFESLSTNLNPELAAPNRIKTFASFLHERVEALQWKICQDAEEVPDSLSIQELLLTVENKYREERD